VSFALYILANFKCLLLKLHYITAKHASRSKQLIRI